ncbi:MAG TPA: hypothetical protein VIW29_18085 [Polyangiaceae bacterium]
MQRSLSAFLLLSFAALLPSRAGAQSKPRPPTAAAPTTVGASAKRPEDRLSDDAELARVAGLYEAGKYAECSSAVESLLDPLAHYPLRQPAIVENARVYWAACLLGQGKPEAADAPLRAAIHENPQMKAPDSLVFPQPVVQRFLKVRDSLISEIRAAEQALITQAQAEARKREEGRERERQRMLELEKLARQELVVVKNRRVLSFMPFGVGQLQNRQEALGYTLMVSEAAAGLLCISAVIAQSRYAAAADELRRTGNAVNEDIVNRDITTWGTVRDVSFWTFAGLAVGGVVQAQFEYVPEFRDVRTRPLPKSLTPVPAPAASQKSVDVSYVPYADPNGGGVTLFGTF